MTNPNQVTYFLAESVLAFDTTLEHTTDTFASEAGRPAEEQAGDPATVVTLGTQADATPLTLRLGGAGADDDFTVTLTADQRVSAVSYKTVGIGGQLVATAGTLIGTVVAAATGGTGPVGRLTRALWRDTRSGERDTDSVEREMDSDDDTPSEPSPEQRARTAWEASHPDEAQLASDYKALVIEQAQALLAKRKELSSASTIARELELVGSCGRLQRALEDARQELARLDTLYVRWRAGTIARRTVTNNRTLTVNQLPTAHPGAALDIRTLRGHALKVWNATGAMVQVEGWAEPKVAPVEDRPEPEDFGSKWAGEGAAPVPLDTRLVWRRPRPVTLSVWKRTRDGGAELQRRFTGRILDDRCALGELPLEQRFFGQQAVSVLFDADGNLTSVEAKETSGLGQFLTALQDVPQNVADGIGTVLKAQTDLGSIEDAEDVRRLAAVKRQVEQLGQELQLKGLAATAEDHAKLARLTQEVSIAEAEGKIAPPSATDRLVAETELVKARAQLADAYRTEALEQEVGALRSEVAKLALEVERATLAPK